MPAVQGMLRASAACCLLQNQTDRLQGDADAMRRRCAELAGRLQESQRALVQAQVRAGSWCAGFLQPVKVG